jgi:hypothetical protein
MNRLAVALLGLWLASGMSACGSVTGAPDGGAGAGGATGAGGTGGSGGVDGPVCTFATTYVIKDGGGLTAMADTATLTPPASFHYERTFFTGDAGRASCDPAMPSCGDPARVDSQDVELALNHPDVQAALAMTTLPFYGNRGVADGPNFNFMRADGRGFNVGLGCDTPSTTCTPIPPGINALVDLLRALIRQQRMDPSCSAIAN